MMTHVGKLLVYLLLVFGLGLVAMAWAIAGNQMNWAGIPTAEPGSPDHKGIHSIKQERIDDQKKEMVRLRGLWKSEGDTLAALEKKREDDKNFYKERLADLRTGDDPRKVQDLSYKPDGSIILDGAARPVFGPNPDEKRLKPLKVLDKDLADKDEELNKIIKDINDLIDEQKKLTLQLRGDPGKAKGLLALLEESDRDLKNAEAELEAARQEAVNSRVAVQALLKRQQQLQARVKELREFNLAQVKP